MKEELKFIVLGIVKSLVATGGLKLAPSILDGMSNENNWVCIDVKTSIITQSTMWCYEYIPIDKNADQYFLQIELQTEFKTVVAINVITNEKTRIIKYS